MKEELLNYMTLNNNPALPMREWKEQLELAVVAFNKQHATGFNPKEMVSTYISTPFQIKHRKTRT